jgi:ribose transport system ATP-binding protein
MRIRREVVAFRHVTLNENGETILNEVSFSIAEGEIVGLVPLDGQGVETLFSLLSHNRLLDRGRMYVDEEEACSYLGVQKLQNNVAVIESRSHLVPALDIADNLFSLKRNSPYVVNRKLERSQIYSLFSPYGMSFRGDEHPDSLSPLQRCAVELAKAGTSGCRLVILRELSTFLPPHDLSLFQDMVRKVAREGRMAFLYYGNHHRELFSICDKVLVMRDGTIALSLSASEFSDATMDVVSRDFLHSLTSIRGTVSDGEGKVIGTLSGPSFSLPLRRGECLVLLDMERETIPCLADTFSGAKESTYHVSLSGGSWEFIPSNPCGKLVFPSLSYLDNLTIRAGDKVKGFYRRHRYEESLAAEFRSKVGNVVDVKNVSSLTQEQLYDLLYWRVDLDNPLLLCVVQPFAGLAMYQRIRLLTHLSRLLAKGISIIILALSLSDSLRIASRLVLLDGGVVKHEFIPSQFEQVADYGIVTK